MRLPAGGLRPVGMKIKTTGLVAMVVGGLCIAMALVYGFSGMLVPSLSERSDNIERWERELAKDMKEAEALIAETEELGKKTDASPAEREKFASAVDRIERDSEHMKHSRDLIEHERGRRTEMTVITAGLGGFGLLALVVGVLLRRRRPLPA